MKPLRIIDKDINFLGEIDNYSKFSIKRLFSDIGSFELEISVNKNNVDKLEKNNLVFLSNDFNKVGIITHKEFSYGEHGVNTDRLLVHGQTLDGLISRRLIVPDTNKAYDSFDGYQEEIIKYFVDKNCVNPKDLKRKITYLEIAENKKLGEIDGWRSSYDQLGEKVKEICEYANLGFNIVLDYKNKMFTFDVISGRDLTVSQNKNPPVIFRQDFNNIKTRKYIESLESHKNVCYIGKKEDEEEPILHYGESEGFERIEVFKDFEFQVSDIDLTKKEALKTLKELEILQSFELEVKPNNTFIYGKDYDMGDIVTVQDRRLGITLDVPITEVEEIHDENGMSIIITFGKGIPTLIETIKRKVK